MPIAPTPRQQAEALAESLPPLLVAAERVAATVQQGIHGRRRAGPGDSFWQFRPYRPGDPPSRIDWRQSARGDGIQVRDQEWEAAQTLFLWCDGSASMEFTGGTNRPTKRQRAELLLLATACLLLRGGERVGLLGGGPPGLGRHTLHRLAGELSRPNAPTNLPPALPLPRYGRAVLFGDFLADPTETERCLSHFTGLGIKGVLVQCLDPDEIDPPYRGRVRFQDPEDAQELLVARCEDLLTAYRQRLAAHRDHLSHLVQRAGWQLLHHATGQPPAPALLALYQALAPSGGKGC